jgi:hypothetical protein
MLPEKLKALDKIVVTIPIQDSLYQSWNSKAVETIKDVPMQRGVIVCKDAISNKGKKSDDLYLAFSLNDDYIRLEEIHGTHNNTACVWEVPYEGTVDGEVKMFKFKCDVKYMVHRKRMTLLTSTFLGIMEYVASNRGNEDLIVETSENVKVVKTPKKGDPVVSYVDTVTFDIKNVTAIEGKSNSGQTGNILWLTKVEATVKVQAPVRTIHRMHSYSPETK